MISCCFTGHREMSMAEQKKILPVLNDKILEMNLRGVTVFRNGGALGFDMLSAMTVLSLKSKYPQIKLYIDVPFRTQSKLWSEHDKYIYDYILSRADKVTYLSEKYKKGCFLLRNRFMVEHSDYVIAYIRKSKGGSYYTASYAENLGKKVVYL